MPRSKDESGITLIADAARSGSARSPLYRWMRAQHDEFTVLLRENRPDWRTLSEGFAKLGFVASEGTPIAPGTARHTWWRVRRDVAKYRAARKKPGRSAVMVETVKVVAPPLPTLSVSPPAPAAGGSVIERLRAEMNARSGR